MAVYRKRDSGSSRVRGSINDSRSESNLGSVSVKDFRPAPGRRTCCCRGRSLGVPWVGTESVSRARACQRVCAYDESPLPLRRLRRRLARVTPVPQRLTVAARVRQARAPTEDTLREFGPPPESCSVNRSAGRDNSMDGSIIVARLPINYVSYQHLECGRQGCCFAHYTALFGSCRGELRLPTILTYLVGQLRLGPW